MVERVLKLLPQLQLTVISAYSGWIDAFMIDLPCPPPCACPAGPHLKKGAQSKPRAPARQGAGRAAVRAVLLSTKSVDKSVGNGSPQPSITRHFCISIDLDTK